MALAGLAVLAAPGAVRAATAAAVPVAGPAAVPVAGSASAPVAGPASPPVEDPAAARAAGAAAARAAGPAAAQGATGPGAASISAPISVPRGAATIAGDYVEARTADVYTGPCFANSEMDLAGKEAVLAWRVRRGSWGGVPLDGLAVVAAVRAAATLGDPFGGPLRSESLLVVDRRATPPQREALVSFARAMAGDLLGRVVAVESAPIEMTVAAGAGAAPGHAHHVPAATWGRAGAAVPAAGRAGGEPGAAGPDAAGGRAESGGAAEAAQPAAPPSGAARLEAGGWIDLATRAIGPQDHLCGNEEVFYPPLTADRSEVEAVPAVTVAYDFRGPGLGMTWSSPGKRNAFVGRFAR